MGARTLSSHITRLSAPGTVAALRITLLIGLAALCNSMTSAAFVAPIPPGLLGDFGMHYYSLDFSFNGSVWDSDFPGFDVNDSVSAGPYGIGTGSFGKVIKVCAPLGGPCIGGGAEADYALTASGGMGIVANSGGGTVSVNYPVDILVKTPQGNQVPPNQQFNIDTAFFPRTATLSSSNPTPQLQVFAKGNATAGLQTQLYLLTQIPTPSIPTTNIDKSLSLSLQDYLSSDTYTQFTCCADVPGIITGQVRIPPIGTQGALVNATTLSSSSAQDFLQTDANVSGIFADVIAGIPLADDLSFGLGDFNYQLLQFGLSMSAGVEQDLTFAIQPQVTLEIREDATGNTSTVSFPAGQSITGLHMPAVGTLTITPIFRPNHRFTNVTSLYAQPGGSATPLRAGAHIQKLGTCPVCIGSQDLDFNPLHAPIELRLDRVTLASYQHTFTLPGVEEQVVRGDPITIRPYDPGALALAQVCVNPNPPTSNANCSRVVPASPTPLPMLAVASGGYRQDTAVIVDGVLMNDARPDPSDNRFITFTLPWPRPSSAPGRGVQLVNSTGEVSNLLQLLYLPAAIEGPALSVPEVRQYAGYRDLSLQDLFSLDAPYSKVATAGAGELLLHTRAGPFQSTNGPFEWIGTDAVLTWDNIPLQTVVTPSTTQQGNVFTTSYELYAALPTGLQVAGGDHRFSIINGGINGQETVLAPIGVQNPIPTISKALKTAPLGISAGGAQLAVSGSGFTPASVVYWDNQMRETSYLSSGGVLAHLSAADLTLGLHSVTAANPAPGGGVSAPFAFTESLGPTVLPFETFKVDEVEIRGKKLEMEGSFTLLSNSDGINPLAEDVYVSAWTFSAKINAGSFKTKGADGHGQVRYEYVGVINGVKVKVELVRLNAMRFRFAVWSGGAELSGKASQVFASVTIGNDGGTAQADHVRFHNHDDDDRSECGEQCDDDVAGAPLG